MSPSARVVVTFRSAWKVKNKLLRINRASHRDPLFLSVATRRVKLLKCKIIVQMEVLRRGSAQETALFAGA